MSFYKKSLLFFLILISCNSFGDAAHVKKYFGNREFTILPEQLDVTTENYMNIAVHYVDKKRKIFDEAIVYKISNDQLEIDCYIINSKVYDKNKNIIFDVTKFPYKFYGWSFQLSLVKKYSNDFSLIYYSDDAKRVTDGPIITWDNNSSLFKKFVIAPSLME